MPQNSRSPRVAHRGRQAGGLFLLVVCVFASPGAADVTLPATRPADGVPAAWKEVKVDWKGSWEETLAANLDPGKTWLKTLEADESLRQAAGLIVRLREIQLLEAMIAHFPQAGAKRQEAYRTLAKAYADMGDRLRAVQWLQRLIADYPEAKPLAGEALADIVRYSHPFDALPDALAWAQFAGAGIESLVKAGAVPRNHPAVVRAREGLCLALREGQCLHEARRYLDTLRAAEGGEAWWRKARADLLAGAGHLWQAAAAYEKAGNSAYASTLRDQLREDRREVDVAPPPPGLEQRLERLMGAIRLTGGKALQDPASVQDILNRCADSGALQTVDDDLQAGSAVLLDRALRELKADVGPLRQWQQQKADARVDALPGGGGEDDIARLARRYPWARRVQEMLIERGEQALCEGRHDRAGELFEAAADHAADPALLAQARLGQWLALAQEGSAGIEALEQAMAQAPDASAMVWRGVPKTAAVVKAFLRRGSSTGGEAALPRSPAGRVLLPAPMAARAPYSRGRWETWSLGPWAIRRIEPFGRQVFFFGPRTVACYDAATLALRWQHAAGGEEPVPEDAPGPEAAEEGSSRPAWRPVAMGAARSSSVGGRAVFALFSRGENGADLEALDAATGGAIWTTRGRPEWEALRILSEPVAGEDVVYVVAMEQDLQRTCTPYLICLSADDARTLWKRRLGTLIVPAPSIAMALYACGVAVHQGAVYVSTNMGILARCDARTGALEWLRTYHPTVAAAVAEGAERRPGRRGRREQSDAGASERARREGSVPLPAGGLVYFAPRDHTGVMALDRQTGQLAWESLLVPSDQVVGLTGRTLIVRDADELAALDAATGEELWSRPVDSEGSAPAVISAGQVLVSAGDKLLRLAAQTGQEAEALAAVRPAGAEHVLLPGGGLVDVAEDPLLERTLAAEAGANPGPLRPPFVKRWALPCRAPQLVAPPATQPPGDLAGVLSGARFYCLRLRPACRLAWQMAFREPPDSAGFQGSLVVFVVGAELIAVDKETGAVRWRRTLPFEADLVAGDDRAIVAGRSSGQAPVMAFASDTGEVLWYRWFGQEARFADRRLRWISLTGESGAPPTVRLYWGAALFAREGLRPAEAIVQLASGALTDVRVFLPSEPIWPSRIFFGDDTRTRPAVDSAIPWPYRGPFRPDAVAYLGKDMAGRFALREGGTDLAAGWNPQADSSLEAARRWAGLLATPAGCYVKRLGQLAFFDAQAKREILFPLPRTAERKIAFAIGDFHEDAGDKLTVVSVAPGRPYETGAGASDRGYGGTGGGRGEGGSNGQFNIVGLATSEFTKAGLHDDMGNGDVTLILYGRGTGSQVCMESRGLPEAGSNLVATLLNGTTREHYFPQVVKMAGLASLGWAKYDVFFYGASAKGPITINGGNPQANEGANFNTPAHRTTLIRNVNYVKFEGVSGDSFTLDFGSDFSAIQVVDASGRPGPRGSLGVRWTGPGPVLGPDDKVGAEVAAGSWYNIVTNFARGKAFALSGGPLTTVAGKRVCGFVDTFDRKTGQVLNSQALPSGDAPLPRTSYDCQAKLLDDALLVTDGNGVYLFRSGP